MKDRHRFIGRYSGPSSGHCRRQTSQLKMLAVRAGTEEALTDGMKWSLGLSVITAIVYADGLCFGVYGAVDDDGWIIHHRHTPTYMDSDWMNAGSRKSNTKGHLTARITTLLAVPAGQPGA